MLIVKDPRSLRSQHKSGRLRYAACVDGSDKSLAALLFCNRLVDRSKGDTLIVVCVETDTVKPQTVFNQVKAVIVRSIELTLNHSLRTLSKAWSRSSTRPDSQPLTKRSLTTY